MGKIKAGNVTLTICLPADVRQQLVARAEAEDRKLGAMARRLLIQKLEADAREQELNTA